MVGPDTQHVIAEGIAHLDDCLDAPSASPRVYALALTALKTVPQATQVRQQLAEALQAAVTKNWILESGLEEVFCVLRALQQHDAKFVEGPILAHALQRLIMSEAAPGGPYISRKAKIEPAANAYIAAFLRQHDVVLPPLQQYIEDCIAKHELASPQLSHQQVLRIVAEVAGPEMGLLLYGLLERPVADDCPATALYLITLHTLKPNKNIEQSVATLIRSLERPFAWQSYNLLNTSLLLEALQLPVADVPDQRPVNQTSQQYDEVFASVKAQLTVLPKPLRTTALQVCEQLSRADTNNEIALLPAMFAESLKAPRVSPEFLQQLGVANFYSWMATIIYDDFIDEEGNPALLPFANTAYRLSLATYRQAVRNDARLSAYIEQLYDLVDRANAWEVAHTRAAVTEDTIEVPVLPRYGRRVVLADRAFGHAVGPMLIAQRLKNIEEQHIESIEKVLQHYLIARQLNDDLHDWRKDLAAGQLSAALTELLRGAAVQPGSYTFEALVPRLENYFLQGGLKKICVQILKHVDLCHQAMDESQLFKTEGAFIRLVDDLAASAKDALAIQAKEQAFLYAYQDAFAQAGIAT